MMTPHRSSRLSPKPQFVRLSLSRLHSLVEEETLQLVNGIGFFFLFFSHFHVQLDKSRPSSVVAGRHPPSPLPGFRFLNIRLSLIPPIKGFYKHFISPHCNPETWISLYKVPHLVLTFRKLKWHGFPHCCYAAFFFHSFATHFTTAARLLSLKYPKKDPDELVPITASQQVWHPWRHLTAQCLIFSCI